MHYLMIALSGIGLILAIRDENKAGALAFGIAVIALAVTF